MGLLAGTIFCSVAGWPSQVWTHHHGYIWAALFGPMVGAVVGCLVLKLYYVVMFNHPAYWLDELAHLAHTIWHGLVPVKWSQVKITQYQNPEAANPADHGGRSRASTRSDLKDDAAHG